NLQAAARRLARRVDDRAVHIVVPAVIAAAYAALGDAAEFERGAAMAAMAVKNADPAAAVAKDDELLAEYVDGERHIGELAGEGDRLPIAPHHLTARRAGAGMGEARILARHIALEIAAEGRGWVPLVRH